MGPRPATRDPGAIPRRVRWCIPALLALHNAEEALAMPWALPLLRTHAPEGLRPVLASVTVPAFRWALALATLLPLALAAWAAARPATRWAQWGVLVVQVVVALNVVSHAAWAAALGAYVPGLLTAVLVNLPFSAYVLRRAWRETWLPRRALVATLPAALLVHGPGLVGLLAFSRALARATGAR